MKKCLFVTPFVICLSFVLVACTVSCSHEWKDATCNNPKQCVLCNVVEGEALGHDYVLTNTKEATCLANGEKTYVCSRCNGTYKEVITSLGHAYVETVKKEATCESAGEKISTCSRCENQISTEIAAIGHKYTSSTTKQPTCTDTGVKTFVCTKCSKTYTETIAASGHQWKDATCTEAQTCSACGATNGKALGHTTDNGVCERCKKLFSKPIVFSGHGDSVVKNINIPSGSFVVHLKHTGSRNFITKLYYGDGEYDYQSLSNEIGKYDGQCALRKNDGKAISNGLLEVTADGDWTIEFTRITETCSRYIKGKGDTVTGLIHITDSRNIVKLTHDGDRNFIVKIILNNGGEYDYESLSNEIGAYNGEVIVTLDKNKDYYIEVIADGNWTIDFGVGDKLTSYK